jgi:hypothetical protein
LEHSLCAGLFLTPPGDAAMRDRQVPWFLAALLAVLGLRFVPGTLPENASAPRGGAEEVAGRSPTGGEHSPSTGETKEENNPGPPGLDSVLPKELAESEKASWEYLIATAPDPFDSSSGYMFDSFVDTLERAAETQQFVLDRYYYPWNGGNKAAGRDPPTSKAAVDFNLARAVDNLIGKGKKDITITSREQGQKEPDRLYRIEPGCLLFRHSEPGKPIRHLAILLVGETATTGIHHTAFVCALQRIHHRSEAGSTKRIRILGPYFSGSTDSMVNAIKPTLLAQTAAIILRSGIRAMWALPHYEIISGSATEINGQAFLSRFPFCFASFHTTVHPGSVLYKVVIDYFQGLGGLGERKIGLVVESNTVYGMQSNPTRTIRSTATTKKDLNALRSAFQELIYFFTAPDNTSPQPLTLLFPLHVSDIRAAYKTTSAAEPLLPQLPSLAGKLQVPVREGPDAVDTEPSLTPKMTAVITEKMLQQMLAVMARERVKYVFLIASDLKDIIFLTTLIRQELPDVQLVLLGGHILLTHPAYRYYFHGAIVASTYPLHSKNQSWSFPFKGKTNTMVLPGEFEFGVYNAAVALLAGESKAALQNLLDYGPPFENQTTPHDGARNEKPPVWLTILGQDGPHPVYYYIPKLEDFRDPYDAEHDAVLKKTYKEQELFLFEANLTAANQNSPSNYSPRYTGYWVWPALLLIGLCGYGIFRQGREPFKELKKTWVGTSVIVRVQEVIVAVGRVFLVSIFAVFGRSTSKRQEVPGPVMLFTELFHPLWIRDPNKDGPYHYIFIGLLSLLVSTFGLAYIVSVPVATSLFHRDSPIKLDALDYLMWLLGIVVCWLFFLITLRTLRAWMLHLSSRCVEKSLKLGSIAAGVFGSILIVVAGSVLGELMCAWGWPGSWTFRALLIAGLLLLLLIVGLLLVGVYRWLRKRLKTAIGARQWVACAIAVGLSIAVALLDPRSGTSPFLIVCLLLFLVGLVLSPGSFKDGFVPRTSAFLVWAVVVCLGRSLRGASEARPEYSALLFVDRSIDLVSGVSPVMPVALLVLAFWFLSYYQIKRWSLLGKSGSSNPFPQDATDSRLKNLAELQENTDKRLKHPNREFLSENTWLVSVVLVIWLFVFWRVYDKYLPSSEGIVFDCLFLLALAGFVLFLSLVFGQASYIWRMTRTLLGEIAGLPMLKAFDRVPGAVVDMFGPYIGTPGSDRTRRRNVRVQQLQALAACYPQVRGPLQRLLPDSVESVLRDLDETLGKREGSVSCDSIDTGRLAGWSSSNSVNDKDPLAVKAQRLLKVLELLWPKRCVQEAYGSSTTETPPGAREQDSGADGGKEHSSGRYDSAAQLRMPDGRPLAAADARRVQTWLSAAEDFVVLEITAALSRLFVQLRNLARALTWAPLMALLALISYPFHPQQYLILLAGLVILILTGGGIWIFLQIEWDEVISRIQKGTPRKIDWSWHFVQNLAFYILPLLGLLAAASVSVSDVLHGWLDPIASLLK